MRAILCLILAMASMLGGAPRTASPEGISIAQLRSEIARRRGRIVSMQGSYVATTSPDAAAEAAKKMIGVAQKVTAHFAWSGEKRLLNETHDAVGEDMTVKQRASSNVYDGTEFRRREQKSFLIQA